MQESIFIFGSVFVGTLYACLIIYILYYWRKNVANHVALSATPSLSISVVICARNEESNISACLKTLLSNDYPDELFEIILVDDHSEDNTIPLASEFGKVQILELKNYLDGNTPNAYKKAAIKYAVAEAQGTVIALTDADCIVGPSWLKNIAAYFENEQLKFLAGPVLIKSEDPWLGRFESLDMMGMMGVTAAGIESSNWYMANGANMAFDKRAFLSLEPFKEKYASGDDIFLVKEFLKQNLAIAFNNDPGSIVMTRSTTAIADFIKQRLRWASKNRSPGSSTYTLVMLLPFLLSLSILINIALAFIYPSAIISLAFLVFIKAAFDYLYLQRLSQYYKQEHMLRHYFLSALCHVFYISGIAVASLFVKEYLWKGRKVH